MKRSSHLQASNNRKPILLSDIKFDSTCVTLCLPYSLGCGNCKTKLDPTIKNRKSKFVKERNKCERRRCQRYWDSSWTIGKDATEGNVMQHNLVRSYLQIESAVTIDYLKPYDRKSKRTKVDDTEIPFIPESTPQCHPESPLDPPHNPSPPPNHHPTMNIDISSVTTNSTTTSPPMNESLTEYNPPTTTVYIPPSIPQTPINASTLNEEIVSSIDTSSYEDLIVSNIRSFLKTSKTKGGAHNTVDTATRDAILTACTFGLPNEVKKDAVREVLGVSKRSFYKRLKTLPPSICSQTYIPPKRKVRVTKIGHLQKESIANFCHSDESSSIDSNSRKVIIVTGEQHVGRVWSVKTVNEQYSLFKQSEVIERYINRYPDFVIPSRSTFIKYRCACV